MNSTDMGRKLSRLAALSLVAFAFSAASGHAHILPGAGGLGDGLAHPLSGLDHILAMAAVGIWAGQNAGNEAVFKWLPAGFIAGMITGALLGLAGLPLSFVELGITGSVVLLGAVIALGRHAPVPAAFALTVLFGGLHGYAHGQELPATSDALLYGLGFVIATVGLHASGFAVARFAAGQSWQTAMRWGGAGIAAAGLALAAG